MKTAIIYYSKSGSSAKCARDLYRKIPDSALFNLAIDTCDISKYDNVILGGGIRAGKIPSQLKKYISSNELEIQKKNVGIFVCCSDGSHANNYIENNFSPILVKKAVVCGCFGAEINPDEMKGIDRIIAKAVLKNIKKSGAPAPQINYAKIDEFAAKFR